MRTSCLRAAIRLALAAVVALAAAGCSSNQTIPDPGPKPSGADFQGVWYSPQFEHMYLRQSGKQVTGVYSYESGGRLEGEVDGNLLIFEWTDPGEKQHATKTMQGRGYFQLVRKGEKLKLEGEWGYEQETTGGGPWEAEFLRKIESDDPSTLEQLENHSE